jgi:tRNA modification GTPase
MVYYSIVIVTIRLLLMMILLSQYRFFCGCYSSSGNAFHLRQYSEKVAQTMGLSNQRRLPVQQLSHYHTKKKPSLPLGSSINNQNTYDSDTIYALSSGGGGSVATAIAVIRISGPQSFTVLDQLMNCPQWGNREECPKTSKQQTIPRARYASIRNLYDPRDGSALDQALVLTFPRPHSFTGEHVVELHCHGSRGVIQGVLDALAALATLETTATTSSASVTVVRPSERGEFTQRAFENGKLNLLQVEALADLILSDTSLQRKQALRNLIGDKLSRLYNQWRTDLTKGLAHAEAIIDFGDDEDLSASSSVYQEEKDNNNDPELLFKTQSSVWGNVQQNVSQLRMAMERHIQDNQRGEIIRQGVRVAIIGPVNAGKSSLLNILAKRDAAIVSPIAGTTRDIVEVIMDLGGVRCIVSDTAGIRDTVRRCIRSFVSHLIPSLIHTIATVNTLIYIC